MSVVGRVREQTLKRLQKFAPTEETYIATWFKTVRNYKKRLSDDRRNETRRVKRRIASTQRERIRQEVIMPEKMYASPNVPTDTVMFRIQTGMRERLPDIECVCSEMDEHIRDWMRTTYFKLLSMACNV